MLRRSPCNFEGESGIHSDQPTVTNPVDDSVIINVAGTNSDAGATADEHDDVEGNSDDVEAETNSDFSEEDSRSGWDDSDEDSEDESIPDSVWDRDSDRGFKAEDYLPSFWNDDDDDDDDLDKNSEDEASDQASSKLPMSSASSLDR
jgi:hypothetical protein